MSWSLSAIAFSALFLAVSWLLGSGLLARLGALDDPPPAAGLTCAVAGIGISALLLFLLALAGLLQALPVLLATAATAALAAHWLRRHAPGWVADRHAALRRTATLAARHPAAAAALAFVALAAVLQSLDAPREWDELAYHLPYARAYASASGLVVAEQLRYPLHPHHFQLIYAAALLFSTAAAAHLLHAAAGALLLAGVYAFARDACDRPTAVLATALTLLACRDLVDTALVDLGLAMFVFYAFYAFSWWQRKGQPAWLTVAAFLLAMAAGVKYQGLLQLPLFALALLVATRSAGPWLRVTAVLAAVGSWWYLRAWLIAGDPLHPFGGPLFGWWSWDAGDLAGQYEDIRRYGHHLPLVLLPALVFAALPGRRRPVAVTLMILAYGGLAAWYLTSRYDRYLLPTWPFLAILSAQVLIAAWRRVAGTPGPARARIAALLPRGALVLAVLAAGVMLSGQRDDICLTRACVERVWTREFPAWRVVREAPGYARLQPYQYGLEDQLYLLGEQVAGDWFGPYRYRDVTARLSDPAALRTHLRALGRDSLLVSRARPGFTGVPPAAALAPHFLPLYEDGEVALYRIAPE